MFRIITLFALFPTMAAADWAPHPTMFNYDASFANCTADLDAPDIFTLCADEITTAYVLKRAVANAAYACADRPLATCTAPFEDEGLPAIALQIALDAQCEVGDVASAVEFTEFGPDNCITIASDIMLDEGVVPVDTDISCRNLGDECDYLSFIQVSFWTNLLIPLGREDPTISDLNGRNIIDCGIQKFTPVFAAFSREAIDCFSTRSATLWADISQQTDQEN